VRAIDPDLRASAISARALALALCAGSSLLEGFNNQTLGVAAPKLFPAFHLTPGQGSLLFTATTAGLAIGSIFGGRWADRYGRKPLLLISVALFGLCSLMTALSTSLPVLFLARLGTGLGTGGAMPNAMAISADAAPLRHRLMLVAIVTAALPLGGATAGLLSPFCCCWRCGGTCRPRSR
jgi:AAHS family 3-hydroxyphenylpropionic acid transporter